jgi:phosphatidylserine decarboxylase
MIKFGSRTDVLIPADAVLKVKTGTRVKGGESVLAVLPQRVVEAARVEAAVAC